MTPQVGVPPKPVHMPTQDSESRERAGGVAARLKRGFLRSLIGSLVLAAAMGIYAFLLGRWGDTEVRILLTTLSVSFCSMTALASAAAFSRERVFPLAYELSVAGVTAAIVAFLLFMGGIWSHGGLNVPYAKAMAIAGIVSLSLGQASLLALASLPRRLRWVYWFTLCAIAAVAALSSLIVVTEAKDAALFRFLGIAGILDGCGTLTIPILARLHGAPGVDAELAETAEHVTLFCPRCGARNTHALGDITCATCGLKLHVAVMKED